MEAEERRKLKDNRSFLIQNIESIDTITDGLFERGVLTRSMWGYIKVQVSKRQKVSTMLHVIPERGPEAFRIFLDMLKETHNDIVYYKLVTDISPRGKFRSQHADVFDIVDDKLPLRSGPLYEHDYDVFLCNSHEDIKWVKILLEKLEMEFHCFLEERDSMPGISVAENGMNAVDRCRKCLFVLSKAFVENPWCKFKVRYAFEKNLENPAKILIPVLIEDCEIPVVLKQYQYIDARNEMEKWLPLLFSAIRSTDLTLPLKGKFALANIERDVLRDLLHKGCYKSYDNRIYLAGPCNVGKSTLASVLIGDDIPTEWNSTNGLQIYFGQNCIDLKEKKMIPLKKDSNLKTITGNQFATTPFSAYKKDYDVYVCCEYYGDQEWYCILVDKLESELGIKCLFGPRDFERGKSHADVIPNAVQRSKTCLLVLSEAYVKGEWSKFEVEMAVNEDIENKGNVVIPVLKEDCEIPYLLKQFPYIDARDKMETWLPRLYRAISSKGNQFATTPFSAYEKDYDVYVCCEYYGDQEWYCILVDKLESELGIKCLICPRNFEPCKGPADVILNAVQRSKTCLFVLSKAYVKGEWSKFEVEIAVNDAIENKGNFVIPLLKEDCEIPYLLKQFKYIDARDKMETWLPRLYRAISSKDRQNEREKNVDNTVKAGGTDRGERRWISENQEVAVITEFVKKPNADVDSQDSLSDILIDRQNKRDKNVDNTVKAVGTDRDRQNERKQNNDNTNKDGDVDQDRQNERKQNNDNTNKDGDVDQGSHNKVNEEIHEIHKDILDVIRKGEYNLDVAPSDLIDFGGQRAFDMIHQIFLSQEGTVLLMFNGTYNLHDVLPEYREKVTTSDILVHWVNSILTYCLEESGGMQIIQFVATHSDYYADYGHKEKRKMRLVKQLDDIFGTHEKKSQLHYDPLFFINGTDECDEEIEKLKDKLVEVAYSQKHWGREMPLAWVPLDKQISDLRLSGHGILHKRDILDLNNKNAEFSMTEEELIFYFKTQHSMGKLLFFDEEELRDYVIIEPVFLLNVLQSFITDELFFPNNQPEIAAIFTKLETYGFILEQDLLTLWKQPEYEYLLQYNEYLEKILELLGVIVKSKTFYTHKEVAFIVPSMVKETIGKEVFHRKISFNKSICMKYVLTMSIPRILFFQLTAVAIGIWTLQDTGEKLMLFQDFASFEIDEDNAFSLSLSSDGIEVYFTNKKSVDNIQADHVASVQECLTTLLTSIMDFYQNSRAGKRSDHRIFQFQYGVICPDGPCFSEIEHQQEIATWLCRHGHIFDVKYLWYWNSHKLKTKRVQQTLSTVNFPQEILDKQQPHDLLRNIALAVGTAGGLLGLKLGLSHAVVEKLMFGKTHNIFQKTEKLLDRWQIMSVDETSNGKLIEALLEIGGRGIETITKFYKLKYICKWKYGTVVEKTSQRTRSKSLSDISHGKCENREWFFKLKFCFEDKYDVHVINSHGIESFYPALEKYIDTKCCKEVPLPGDINKVNNCSVFLFNHRRLNIGNNLSEDQWKQILHSSIQKNQDLLCRYILANRQFLNDDIKVWLSVLEYSIRRQNSTCSKAIAWHITKLFVKSLSSLKKVFDIWPGFRCSCSAGVELKMKQNQICSQNVVMVVEVYDEKPNEFPNHFHNYKIQYKISNGYSEEGKSVVLETNRRFSDFEPETLPRGIKPSVAETYFQNYSKLALISPSLLKSRFFKSNQTFVQVSCLQLYCRVKGVIPIGEDHFPTSISSIPTDVLEGHSQLLMKSIRVGSEIGPISGGSGTLGGFVQYLGTDAFITCAHVVLSKECLFKSTERKKIHQQPVKIQYINQGETGNPTVCGKLINYMFPPDCSKDGTSVDAAIVMLDDSTVRIDPNDVLLDNGIQRTFADFGMQSVYLNDSFIDYKLFGTAMQITSRSAGIVSGIQEKVDSVMCEDENILKFEKFIQVLDRMLIQNPRPQHVTEDVHIKEQIRKIDDSTNELPPTVTLYNQISFRNISFNQGDSGTCIYVADPNNTVSGCIGMAIASHPNGGCIVTPIKAILSAFKLI